MLICHSFATFLLLAPVLGFLSHFSAYDHLYPRLASYAEPEARKAYKRADTRKAYTIPDVYPHARWGDVLYYSLKKRTLLPGLTPQNTAQSMPRVESSDAGIARFPGYRDSSDSTTSTVRGTTIPRTGGGGVRKVSGSRPGSPRSGSPGSFRPGSPRGSRTGSPRGSRPSSPRAGTGGPSGLKGSLKIVGSQSSLKKSVSWQNLQNPHGAEVAAEHAAEGSFRGVSHAAAASGEIAELGRNIEHSKNLEVKVAGAAIVGAADAFGHILEHFPKGAERKKEEEAAKRLFDKVRHDVHPGRHHDDRLNEAPPTEGLRPRPGMQGGSIGATRGSTGPRGSAHADPEPPHDPYDKVEHSHGSSGHESDEAETDIDMHQDAGTNNGYVRYKGLRPRPDKGENSGGGGGGGKASTLPSQSIRGKATRNGQGAGRPGRPKKVPKKHRSSKLWNSYSGGLTAAGVLIAGGATIGSTIAAEKGAEANVKNANADQLAAQAAQKNAAAAQLQSLANTENAHATTIIAEANVKNANASKENADGTALNAAVTYQTAVHTHGVNVTAAMQMAQHAAKTNTKKRKRDRSYPVILYTQW